MLGFVLVCKDPMIRVEKEIMKMSPNIRIEVQRLHIQVAMTIAALKTLQLVYSSG